ncbi:RNA polymerase-binding protein RbpA [Actinoplanes sp. TRM 88003]|uniref:RNA polymerase-binding protein RbpA n=1 Tax=Paractinoplanes aksuensis TaxID=2939490 RepID=A0ABT1DZJ7_9ACTN|nr:RNA polymerase-binding protein RbpA [Actinoplanes aksuensis]MCO8276318.1 RNA polymerase-binding protein RbpA [Actinoplanes aksuensis]
MSSGSAIRGSRVGSSPVRPDERSEPAPRREVTYFCAAGHASQIWFSAEAPTPDAWDCPRCGQPAGLDRQKPPGRSRAEPYKSHLAYVKERRTDEDGAKILEEALAKLRQRRGRGD